MKKLLSPRHGYFCLPVWWDEYRPQPVCVASLQQPYRSLGRSGCEGAAPPVDSTIQLSIDAGEAKPTHVAYIGEFVKALSSRSEEELFRYASRESYGSEQRRWEDMGEKRVPLPMFLMHGLLTGEDSLIEGSEPEQEDWRRDWEMLREIHLDSVERIPGTDVYKFAGRMSLEDGRVHKLNINVQDQRGQLSIYFAGG